MNFSPAWYNNVDDKISWDPVDLRDWAFTYQNTLINVSTAGSDFEFNISYDNQAEYDGIIWYNWDHNWNKFIVQSWENLTFYDGNLKNYIFHQQWDKRENPRHLEISFDWDEAVLNDLQNWIEMKFAPQNEEVIPWRMTSYKINWVEYELNYDEEGYLTEIIDPQNNSIILSYKELENWQKILEKVQHPNNKTVNFEYYTNYEEEWLAEDIQQITINNAWEERKISFTYDTKVEYLEDEDWETLDIIVDHVNSHNITTLTDSENQIYVENVYENDRVRTQKYGEDSLNFEYSEDGESETVIETRNWEEWKKIFDEEGNVIKIVNLSSQQEYVFNYEKSDGNLIISIVYPDETKDILTYDLHGNILEKQIEWVEKSKEKRMYNEKWRLISYKWKDGISQNFDYDEAWNITKIIEKSTDWNSEKVTNLSRTNHNKISEILLPDGQKFDYIYNGADLPIKITQIAGTREKEIRISYDENNNPKSIIDAEWNETKLDFSSWNLLKETITPEWIKTKYSYDETNLLKKMETILENGEKAENEFEYDILWNLIEISHEIDEWNIWKTKFTYDKDENLISIKDQIWLVWNYEYDDFGNIIHKKTVVDWQTILRRYEYNIRWNLTKITDPKWNETKLVYNLAFELVELENAQWTKAKISYDEFGNIVQKEIVDQNWDILQKMVIEYDKWNQIIKINELSETQTVSTQFVYNQNQQLIKKIFANGGEENYEYDEFGRMVKEKDTLWNQTIYEYNLNDKVVKVTVQPVNWTQKWIEMEYDRDSRLIKEKNSLSQEWNYVYNNLNQLISATDPEWNQTEYVYDYDWNLISTTQNDWNQNIITQRSYDKNWNQTSLIDGNGNETKYFYDEMWRLTKIKFANDSETLYQYDENWNMIRSQDANGTVVLNTYNELNQLISRQIQKLNGVVWVGQENYEYDGLWRLISATYGFRVSKLKHSKL